LDDVAELLGVVSLIAVAVAVATGAIMRRRPVPFRKAHRVVGTATAALAIVHGLAMLLD
jgi:NAD/NADP transhydrogenase alpha subunit